MINKKIMIIGQLGDRKTGLGKALGDIFDYSKKKLGNKNVEILDISNNRKIFLFIYKILISSCEIFYFTPSGSLGGHLRDILYLVIMMSRRKKIVLHFHNSNYQNVVRSSKLLVSINNKMMKKVSRIILLGNKQKLMFNDIKSLTDNIFYVIPNSIDEGIFINESEFNEKTGKNIIYFSNMIESKGYLKVLEASKKLAATDLNFTFSGKFFNKKKKHQFMDLIATMKNVKYYPGVYGEEKNKLLKTMDIFILPSDYKDETLPISMLEAMAAGMYVIISDRGVVKEYVNDLTSTILERKDVSEIVEAIENVPKNLIFSDFRIDDYKRKFNHDNIMEMLLNAIVEV